jgi:hypothetical protein
MNTMWNKVKSSLSTITIVVGALAAIIGGYMTVSNYFGAFATKAEVIEIKTQMATNEQALYSFNTELVKISTKLDDLDTNINRRFDDLKHTVYSTRGSKTIVYRQPQPKPTSTPLVIKESQKLPGRLP